MHEKLLPVGSGVNLMRTVGDGSYTKNGSTQGAKEGKGRDRYCVQGREGDKSGKT